MIILLFSPHLVPQCEQGGPGHLGPAGPSGLPRSQSPMVGADCQHWAAPPLPVPALAQPGELYTEHSYPEISLSADMVSSCIPVSIFFHCFPRD